MLRSSKDIQACMNYVQYKDAIPPKTRFNQQTCNCDDHICHGVCYATEHIDDA